MGLVRQIVSAVGRAHCPQNSSSASLQASRYRWIRRDSAGRPTTFSAHARPEDTDAPSGQRHPILSETSGFREQIPSGQPRPDTTSLILNQMVALTLQGP